MELIIRNGMSPPVALVAADAGGRRVRRLGRRTELVELRAKVGELRTIERLLERELAEVKAERDRLLDLLDAERARVDRLLAERPAERPARRRWWWWRRRGGG
jgi:chromosome segregation ATPase